MCYLVKRSSCTNISFKRLDLLVKILVVHNCYQNPGGEDAVFEAETSLLSQRGHEVIEFVRENVAINQMSAFRTAVTTIWSHNTGQELYELIQKTRPDIVHFHNTFLLVSPAAYYACREAGVPVVQTLHNYRILCPAATFFRQGQVCEQCMNRQIPWPGIVHGCWRNSRLQTTVVAAMLTFHRWLQTWEKQVDIYIALTEFARNKFIEGGLPAEKIVVKPNFVHPDPGSGPGGGRYALFVGRLSAEKGLKTLLAAWEQLNGRVPLKILGDGPQAAEVQQATKRIPGIEWLGQRNRTEVYTLMDEATFLVFPSIWYEGFPMVLAEAFAKGLPVISSELGSQGSIVENGRTGLHFRPGDPEDLAAKVEWAWTHPGEMRDMSHAARAEYEAKYTAERNYHMLMDIYRRALELHV